MHVQPAGHSSKSLWHAPYAWLTIPAITELVISAIILTLLVYAVYDELTYMNNPRSGIGPAIERPSLAWKLSHYWPTLVTASLCSLGGFLLLSSKKKIGAFPSLVGLFALAVFLIASILGAASGPWQNRAGIAVLAFIANSPIAILCFMLIMGLKRV